MSDKHAKHQSKYTVDRMIPGAFEGETVTRRRFMTVSSQAMGGIAAASFLLPSLGFAMCVARSPSDGVRTGSPDGVRQLR